jgi:hypothetical protein
MNDETHALRDVSHLLKLTDLPAAIRLEMIGKRLDWHEAHVAKDWPRAKEAFGALCELHQLYNVQPVTDK